MNGINWRTELAAHFMDYYNSMLKVISANIYKNTVHVFGEMGWFVAGFTQFQECFGAMNWNWWIKQQQQINQPISSLNRYKDNSYLIMKR